MDKKNFVINDVPYKIVIGTKNFLEYRQQYKSSSIYQRKRIYKGFDQSNDIDLLYKHALNVISKLHKKPIDQLLPKSILHDYLDRNKFRYKERTYLQFVGVANRFVAWCEAHKVKPDAIKLDQCLKYINYMNANAIGNNTIFNVLLVLKAVYNGLIKESKIKENPFILVPKIKRSPVSLMYFNDAQIVAMKGYCAENNKQLWIAIQLLFSCFVRPGELRLIQIYDVNLHDGYIEIKGDISKNGKTEKVIIPDYVRSQLSFLNNYPGYFYIIGKNGYPSADPVGSNYLNKAHRNMLQALKIRGNYAYYSWKHTGVVKAVKAGINIKELQLQLRHSSLDMVNEYLKNLGVLDSDMIRHHFPTI